MDPGADGELHRSILSRISTRVDEIATTLGLIRARAARSRPVAGIRSTAARRQAERLPTSDPTLAAVRRALLTPADGEREWSRRIEAVRGSLAASSETISFGVDDPSWWERAIPLSKDPRPPVLRGHEVTRNVGEVTGATSKPDAWGRLFFRIVRALRPRRCLELGTSVGMSASYIGAGLAANGDGRLVTIEGIDAVADIARRTLSDAGVGDHVAVVTGRFADRLDGVLETLGGVDLAFIDGHHLRDPTLAHFHAIAPASPAGGLLIFDDVSYWHEGMEEAWTAIRGDPRITGSLTVESVGFAVVGGAEAGHRGLNRLTIR
jgi:predicted O-methyltransferase YrrM